MADFAELPVRLELGGSLENCDVVVAAAVVVVVHDDVVVDDAVYC